MSLARTALRLIVSAALKGRAGARPSIAEGRWYDSRISELAPEMFGDDAKATGIITTDQDEGDALSAQNGGPPFKRLIDLTVEFGMILSVRDDAGYVVGYPDTDRRLEASLDLLEFQVLRRLGYDPDPLCVLFRKLVRIHKHDCHRQVTDDAGVKLACRLLTLTCEIVDDRVEIYNASGAIPAGLDVLPDPLKTVARAMAQGSSELDTCMTIAATLSLPLEAPAFEGMDAEYGNKVSAGRDDPSHKVEAPSRSARPAHIGGHPAMTEYVYVKPREDGRVRMPERNFRPMPPEGAWVYRRIDYYERLIICGDLIVCDPPEEMPAVDAPPATGGAPRPTHRPASPFSAKED